MASQVPQPQSFQQILGAQLNTVRARLGLKRFKPGGPLLSLFESAAQSDSRNAADIFTALLAQDLENASGLLLDRIGNDERLPRRSKKSSRGEVVIFDASFPKLSTTIYCGKSAPIVGSTVVYVSKGGTFDIAPLTGQIYIGRGTPNYEGALAYSAKVDAGSFWTITLASPTTRFHNQGESVVLAQGGSRPIQVGQIVSTTQGAATAPVTFTITQSVNIPDGETEADAIQVLCTIDGLAGNLPPGSIVSFGNSTPFANAQVTNSKKIDFGKNVETDNEYRDRIRQARANKQRGTAASIKNAVIDVSSTDETSSILSANVVKRKNKPTVLYIDDGNGYEEKSSGLGFESIIDSASGGETDFLSVFSPIAQAYVEAANQAPYTIPDGSELTIRVGGVSSTHFFDSAEFTSPLSASAYDVVSSVNANSNLLFQARITQNGQSLVFYSKSETNDDLQVILGPDSNFDAAIILGLNTAPTYTTSLYKNDVLLSKDGALAQVVSNPFSSWGALSGSESIVYDVDSIHTGIAYGISDADFQALGYPLLNNANPQVWAEVLTSRLPGITATAENDRVILTSNKGKNAAASVAVISGTLVTKGMFSTFSSQGVSNDYSIDRSVGAIAVNAPLTQNDKLSLGTQWPEAFVETDFLASSVLVSVDSSYYVTVDDILSTVIPTGNFKTGGLYSSVLTSSGATPTGSYFDIKSGGAIVPVPELKEGDWVLLNDSEFDIASPWKGMYRTGASGSVLLAKDADTATRIGHTSTALIGGYALRVLVAGGLTTIQDGIGLPGALKGRGVTGNCQLYNSTTGSWTQLPDMITPRAYHTATLLTNGKVFIAGGFDVSGNPLASTELFDPTTNIFTAGAPMPTSAINSTPLPRVHHTATLLGDPSVPGNTMVLIAGGCSTTNLGDSALTSALEYSPGSNSYQHFTNMATPRYGHQAVLDTFGFVIAIGGISTIANPATPIASVEAYNPGGPSWANRNPMAGPRAFFGAVKLLGGAADRVMVAGNGARFGIDNATHLSAETGTSQAYISGTDTWQGVQALNIVPGSSVSFIQNDLVASNQTNKVIAYPLSTNLGFVQTLTYDAGTNTWSVYSADPGVGLYMDNREATRAATLISGGPSGDSAVWFGGATKNTSLQNAFSGITNPDKLDLFTTHRTNPFPVFTDLSLNNGRVVAVRSKFAPEAITVPAGGGTFYTADSFAPALNLSSSDTVSTPYQTTKVRMSTLSTDGSLSIVDQDPALPIFSPQRTVISQRSQLATVTSNSDLDVPSDFQIRTLSAKKVGNTTFPLSVILPDYSDDLNSLHCTRPVTPNGTLVGLKNYQAGSSAGIEFTDGLFGNGKGTKAVIGSFSSPGTILETSTGAVASLGSYLGLRSSIPAMVGNPVYVADPFKFSVTDTLNVIIDKDTDTKRFAIPMARKLATNGTYQSPLSLKDADNSNHTVSTAFGINYDFNDFAILSRARVVTDSATAGKRILWRYYRYGEEGNSASLRYVYPTGPSQPVSVSTNAVQSLLTSSYYKGLPKTTVDVNIGSGVLRQNRNVSINTRFGTTKGSPVSTANHVWSSYIFTGFTVIQGSRAVLNGDTTLDILIPYVPGTVGDLGLNPGDVLWYEGNSPSSSTLQTGQFTIKTVVSVSPGHWRITVNSYVLNDGTVWAPSANPGLISTDPNQLAKFDSEVIVGDLVTIKDQTGTITTDTMRISSIDPNKQYIACGCINFDPTTHTVPQYSTLQKLTDIQIFAPGANTATAIVAAVNANTKGPLTAVVTGTGSDVINLASWDTFTAADYRYNLSDGINYISNTNKPANTTLQTTFDLKLPVNSALVSNSDFTNETFYIVPQLAKSVVKWLNTPAITGLWSVAKVTTCYNGEKVQIKSNMPGHDGSVLIEGGNANSKTAAVIGSAQFSLFNSNLYAGLVLTATSAEAEGFCGNSWVELNNTEAFPKVTDTAPNWGPGNTITSIDANGKITFSGFPYYLQANSVFTFSVERVGKYTTYNFYKPYGYINLGSANYNNFLYVLAGAVDTVNTGIFRILNISQTEAQTTFWVDNPNAVEQSVATSVVRVIPDYGPIPGDILAINSDVFGSDNRGSWKIVDVGTDYTDHTITVDISSKKTAPFTGTVPTLVKDVSIIEKAPKKAIKKLVTVSPNTLNSNNADLLLDDWTSISCWNEAAGTVVSSLNKLGFPNTVQVGNDAYRYNTGLIAAAKRVIYGDSNDPDNFPGFVADGAQVLIQGPTIKRIKMTLQVRLQSNSPGSDIVGSIKSAVAGAINDSPVGQPIAISDLISVAQSVNGVIAVSVISPAYNSVQDQIDVRGSEKPTVVDFDADIKVLVVGN